MLCSSNSGCLGWFKKLCCKEEPPSPEAVITYNNSTSNNDDKINEKKITHENLFIIGDIEKCKEVMEKLGADDSSSEEEVTIYKKEIIDDNWHKTFKFYICGNEVGKCEEIYNKEEQSSFFFFFVDITDSNLENNLVELLQDFKQNFLNETSRFFLILLKTGSQGGGDIKVGAAEEFCKKNKLKFFGVIDSKNIIWDFEDKDFFYRAIGDIEFEYQENKNNYKLGEMKWDNDGIGNFCYKVKKNYDIWGMFLCGVKYEKIIKNVTRKKYRHQMRWL